MPTNFAKAKNRSLLKILCKRAVVETTARQIVLEKYGELVHRFTQVLYRHCPFFRNVFQG